MDKPYKLILWDVDGTLMDFDRAQRNSLREVFLQHHLPFSPEILHAYIHISHGLWEAFEQGEITKDRLQIERFFRTQKEVFGTERVPADTLNDHYLSRLSLCTFPEEGAEEVLRTLFGKSDMAIITNGVQKVQEARYQHSFLKQYIKEKNLFISETVGHQKPSPAYFDAVFSGLNMEGQRKHTLVVGDSLTADMLGGQQAGAVTCWYNPGGHPNTLKVQVDFEIRKLQEVIAIVMEP